MLYQYPDIERLRMAIAKGYSDITLSMHADVVVDPESKKVIKTRFHSAQDINTALSISDKELDFYRDLLK
ncbi:hypothetical protein [Pseudomonas phage Astolliot]|nr:hypothetical protein [Pseudomonas phage Astolliot]